MKVVEPFAVLDTFVTDLWRVDIMSGGFARFVLCVERPGETGEMEMRVAAKIVMPVSSVPDAIMKATQAAALGTMGLTEAAFN